MIPAGLFLADTSAIARVRLPAVEAELRRLGREGLLARCVTIDLEVLYSARSPSDHATIAAARSEGLIDLPLREAIGRRAAAVQARMAVTSQHRAAGVVDLLTAAIAEHYGATVLHYDADFEAIAAVTAQPTRWVVPRGSVP